MLLSLSTACLFPWPLPVILRLAAETGFDGVELVVDPHLWLFGPRSVRRWARDLGLEIYSIHQTYLPLSPSGPGSAVIMDAARAALALDCSRVVVHGPFVRCWREPHGQRWLADFQRAQQLLKGSEVQLSIENVGVYTAGDHRNVLAPIPVLRSFARRYGVGITLDVCHLGANQLDPLEAYGFLRDDLINIHLSDQRDAELGRNRIERALSTHHQMPGEGRLPLVPFLERLEETAYSGPITFEVSPSALQIWSLSRARQRLERAIVWARSRQSLAYGDTTT